MSWSRSTEGSVVMSRCTTPGRHVARGCAATSLERGVVASCNAVSCVSHPRRRAQSIHHALLAFRPSRDADAPPVLNEGVREPGPLGARHQLHQVLLDLLG